MSSKPRWTEGDDKILIDALYAKTPFDAVANALGRTIKAVDLRATKLRYLLKHHGVKLPHKRRQGKDYSALAEYAHELEAKQ